MVRDIMGLMEILSFLYMVAAVYNVKMNITFIQLFS